MQTTEFRTVTIIKDLRYGEKKFSIKINHITQSHNNQ